MKKFLALLVVAALCVGCLSTVAFAEDAAEDDSVAVIDWSDLEETVEGLGIEGEFVSFDEAGLMMWIPDVFEADELTDEDVEMGYIGYYMTEDESSIISVVLLDMGGLTLEEYEELLIEDETISDVEEAIVNDIPCITYYDEDTDAMSVTIEMEDGYFFEATFAPMSDEGFAEIVSLIAGSIMVDEEAVEEAAEE